jgi:hypothetical protein
LHLLLEKMPPGKANDINKWSNDEALPEAFVELAYEQTHPAHESKKAVLQSEPTLLTFG